MDAPENGWTDEEQTGSWAEERGWRSGEWDTFADQDDDNEAVDGATDD